MFFYIKPREGEIKRNGTGKRVRNERYKVKKRGRKKGEREKEEGGEKAEGEDRCLTIAPWAQMFAPSSAHGAKVRQFVSHAEPVVKGR